MKPAWDALMADYKDHPTKLVADVDCTAAGRCATPTAQGLPDDQVRRPADLQSYEGGRDEKALKAFAETKLVAMCSVKNQDLCSEEKKAEIAKFMAMEVGDLNTKIEEQEAELKNIEADFKKSVEGLQKLYEGYTKEKEEKMAALKDSGLGLMKSVKAAKAKAAKDEL
ncbi:intramolecular oxidoreductase [Aureococcus anophagefferens]|nr:intramolecular oxidoreductase [Aureococcus anophagefferens]